VTAVLVAGGAGIVLCLVTAAICSAAGHQAEAEFEAMSRAFDDTGGGLIVPFHEAPRRHALLSSMMSPLRSQDSRGGRHAIH